MKNTTAAQALLTNEKNGWHIHLEKEFNKKNRTWLRHKEKPNNHEIVLNHTDQEFHILIDGVMKGMGPISVFETIFNTLVPSKSSS